MRKTNTEPLAVVITIMPTLSKTEQSLLERIKKSPNKMATVQRSCYFGPGKPRPYGRREYNAAISLNKKGITRKVSVDKSIFYKNGYGDHVYSMVIELATNKH